MSVDYNKTVNLPKTDFPMRAGLPQKEPEFLKKWEELDLYNTLMRKNEGKPRFVLHDGPPFSNGDIHIGTAMNKILKDFIVRYKNMSGYQSPYVPGWDNHGMPIESAIIKQNKLDRKNMSISQFRDACHAFAADFVDRQRDEFIRLGVTGDWEHPYLTMDPAFEAKEVRVFGRMYEAGYIYKGLKPVYWCPHDETALAEAEIEYGEDPCDSIYVKFAVKDDGGRISKYTGSLDKVYFVIWTTTAWTIPGNLGICLGPDFEYAVARFGDEIYIAAKELLPQLQKAAKLPDPKILAVVPGSELEYVRASHPLLERDSLVIVGDHVTLESGTGCVHTAPGHGVEDFAVCKNYPQIEIVVPVDDKGRMTAEAGRSAGLYVDDASKDVTEELREKGALLAVERIVHQYPHCWRCKHPIIFRATEQWFASVDAIKERAVAACDGIRWNPEWGKERMIAMIRERSDWCISRQRHWGLPIPVFYCEDCKKPVCTEETIGAVAGLFWEKGSNAWFETDAADILPKGFSCPHCGGGRFTKETDTLDGWFDSGSTHAAVLDVRPELHFPADIYLEGGDQYRGWFQSSMLTSIAVRGVAPYRQIITHGWTVDGEGKAMHKSLGNAVSPDEVIKDYGADILRLWVASTDYRADVRISKDILKQLSEVYRKIRNTARFILGNLDGFDPGRDLVPVAELPEIDRWALIRLNRLTEKVRASYERYEFYLIYHAVHNFCVIEMSNFYLDVIKDRLYVEKADSRARRAAQTAMYRILDGLVRMLAPILAFTAEEIWQYMPHCGDHDPRSVSFNELPEVDPACEDEALLSKWDAILALRDDVKKALELARAEKVIGGSLEAHVVLHCDEKAYAFAKSVEEELTTVFITSAVTIMEGGPAVGYTSEEYTGISVEVLPAKGEKCARCWVITPEVGQSAEHPALCPRCASILEDERA